eukprot:scaffold1514_cov113-Skeletonema_dohrnii-CCMP3373.AAC.9
MENDRNAVNRRLKLEGIQDIRIDVTNSNANKEKQHDAANQPDPSSSSSELPSKTKSRPIKKKVEAEEEATYVPRWNSSSAKPLADAD